MESALQAGRRIVGAALAVLAMGSSPARGDATAPPAFAAVFDACVVEEPDPDEEYWARFDEDEDAPPPPGLEELCPDLYAALAASELAPFLPPDWAELVSPAKLRGMRELLAPPVAPAGRRPDPGIVASVLADIQTLQLEREKTLWQRFTDWLKRILERKSASADSRWLDDWLREHAPSERVVRGIFTGLVILLVAGLLWVIYVELRAAGLLGRRRAGSAEQSVSGAASAPRRMPTLADASESELPAVLIALLLEQLRRLGQVQDRRSMTHRELVRAARFDSEREGETFRALVAAAERLRYAAMAPAAEALRGVVSEARSLLEGLSRRPSGAA